MTIAIVAFSLGLPAMVRGQEVENKTPIADRIATSVFAASATADWITTYHVMQLGGREQNPMISPLQKTPVAMIAVGAGIDIAGYYILRSSVGKRHPKLFRTGLYAASAFRFSLAIKNTRVAKKQREINNLYR